MMRDGMRRDRMWSLFSVGRRGKGWNVCGEGEVASGEIKDSVGLAIEAETRSWDEVVEDGMPSGLRY